MTMHLSARVAWHMDGWNGRICRDPAANTYCVGSASYPGEMIAEQRDLEWEKTNAGRCCSELKDIPPCMYSINAFGTKELTAYADPPNFFRDGSRRRGWNLPAATVCLWDYDDMYNAEGVRREGDRGFDYDLRLKLARDYWARVKPDRSLIFYYANYSNPFSEDDNKRYVIVGMSRVKALGDIMFYENCSETTKNKYGGGFVWQLPVTSHYPDEGFRLPYHGFLDQPDVLAKFLCVPENPRNFKYATRQFTDDDALVMVEQMLDKVTALRDMGDRSEDWPIRLQWLQSLIAELWECRGLYPGLTKVLDYLEFSPAIMPYRKQVERGDEKDARDALFAFLDGRSKAIPWVTLTPEEAKRVVRQWKLKSPDEQRLLRDLLPRFDLQVGQMGRILAHDRAANCIEANLSEISDNPYLLSEQFVGDGPDDTISFSKIDHGVHPSPDLGGDTLSDLDDWRRFRALCVERLRREDRHTFMTAAQVIHDVDHRLSLLPEWKRHQFTERYLAVDEEDLEKALTARELDGKKFLYLKQIYDDERLVERVVRDLANRPDISLRSPVTLEHWQRFLFDETSDLAKKNPKEYGEAILGQAEVCEKIFVRPICVVSGAAGTGKTTIISALVKAIEKAHGGGTSFQLLAPTGKAADRIRERVGKDATTIHSFLAQHGWLNDNMTFRRSGGRREESKTTYIIDEASMVNLELIAALFRAINFRTVQRLIFVGDPNQLPPIGRGRVFSDTIDWMGSQGPESIGTLAINVRQMENRVTGRGTGILDLASLYVRKDGGVDRREEADPPPEHVLRKIQEGGEVCPDLRVIYWKGSEDLAEKLRKTLVADLENDTKRMLDPARPYELWSVGFDEQPEKYQVISPYRGEQLGTEHLNVLLQELVRGRPLEHGRNVGGIALFDKVMQVINRAKSNPMYAYSLKSHKTERIEVFNGELGFTKPHGFDGSKWKSSGFQIRRLQVVFSRKRDYWADYGSEGAVTANLELAYAISVHKAQGSEFGRVYFVVPKYKKALLSRELFYTGLTRASGHCTLLVEEDISPLLTMRRPEQSYLVKINSSLFELRPIPEAFQTMGAWYEEGRIHRTLTEIMVRSESEVIIANMLAERDIPFRYEVALFAKDGTFYLPDFTINARGDEWYWEHVGRLDQEAYRNHWETKKAWYHRFFPGRLVVTEESGKLSQDANRIIEAHFS
ncbi:MAG: AAA family ATPase [Isosphaerales bacterium]